jgi:hypothetical protein
VVAAQVGAGVQSGFSFDTAQVVIYEVVRPTATTTSS